MLSACMIVKNETNKLSECFNTLVGHVDEIVVVDTGSTDGTQYLIDTWIRHNPKQGKTKFVYDEFEWNDSFSDARNYSMSKASGDWIFIVDADDRVDVSDWDTLQKFLDDPADVLGDYHGIACDVLNVYNGVVRSRIAQPRFFQKSKNPEYKERVHNQITFPDAEKMSIVRSPFRIYHIGYGMLSAEELKAKTVRIVTMTKKAVDENPKDAFAWYNYAVALKSRLAVGEEPDYKKIIDAYQKCIENVTTTQKHLMIQSYNQQGWMHYLGKDKKSALLCADMALDEKPDYIDAMLLKGYVYADSGDFRDAEFWLNKYMIESQRYNYSERFDPVVMEKVNERAKVYQVLSAIEIAKEEQRNYGYSQ